MVTYAVKGSRYVFELWYTNAPANSYAAVAISKDSKMVFMFCGVKVLSSVAIIVSLLKMNCCLKINLEI